MAQFLLDTDICIELIKQNERILDKVESVGADHCFVTEITIAELFYGAAKSGRPDHFNDVDYILQSFDLKPLLPSLRLYGENNRCIRNKKIEKFLKISKWKKWSRRFFYFSFLFRTFAPNEY